MMSNLIRKLSIFSPPPVKLGTSEGKFRCPYLPVFVIYVVSTCRDMASLKTRSCSRLPGLKCELLRLESCESEVTHPLWSQS
ncbi:hypothetical protein LEMLEM_LOCUS7112 [Lemmus lemmus]